MDPEARRRYVRHEPEGVMIYLAGHVDDPRLPPAEHSRAFTH